MFRERDIQFQQLPAKPTQNTISREQLSTLVDWNQQQAAATPTLLPTLRFHDLVFGWQNLGEGTFSTVKYARQIVRDRPRSEWPEFAIKVVSAVRLRELRYHAAIEREMAVLRLLGHPGVCRLISAFRYTGSAYLVIEFAGKGDLHSHLTKHGRLDALATRFVLGEICAALLSLHGLGFSYNDLKPENVLITVSSSASSSPSMAPVTKIR